MEEKNKVQSNFQPAQGELTVRTMRHDLEIAEEETKQKGSVAEPKIPLRDAQKETAEKKKLIVAQLLEQSLAAFKENDYQKTIYLSEKIIKDKAGPWLVRYKAKKLIKKCQRIQERFEKEEQRKLKEEKREILRAEKTKKTKMGEKAVPATSPVRTEKEETELLPDYLPIQKTAPPQQEEPASQPLIIETEKQEFIPLPSLPPPEEREFPSAPIIELQQPEEVQRSEEKYQPPAAPAVFPHLGLIPKEVFEAKPPDVSLKKLGIIAGSAALFLAVLLGYVFWPKPQTQQEEPSQTTEEQIAPSALFYMEQEKVIETEQSNLSSLPQKIQSLAQENQVPGEFVHLIPKFSDQQRYFSAFEVFDALNLASISLDCSQATSSSCQKNSRLIDNIDDKYSLFFYVNKETELSTSTVSTSSAPVRFGLIVKLTDSVKAKEILTSAEPELVGVFGSALLGEKAASESGEFKENRYGNVVVRYINLPERLLSVDYAIYNDYLLFATSKESALTALDRILQP